MHVWLKYDYGYNIDNLSGFTLLILVNLNDFHFRSLGTKHPQIMLGETHLSMPTQNDDHYKSTHKWYDNSS